MSHRPVILKLPFNISTRIRGDTKGGERAHTVDCGHDYLLFVALRGNDNPSMGCPCERRGAGGGTRGREVDGKRAV